MFWQKKVIKRIDGLEERVGHVERTSKKAREEFEKSKESLELLISDLRKGKENEC